MAYLDKYFEGLQSQPSSGGLGLGGLGVLGSLAATLGLAGGAGEKSSSGGGDSSTINAHEQAWRELLVVDDDD